MMRRKAHSEQGYRACLGLLNLSRNYDAQRLDRACHRALCINSPTVRSVKSILQQGIDQLELPIEDQQSETDQTSHDEHDNIRGSQYFH